ncbi:response regulator transcription factor [Rariglobus hedericola]|uniref:Response regulator transcription factor n=1 Tax=Rariglobus hedericola TaxID=2597822 RepID=A0A556QLA5_9BACT|nr:response regulator transcription factor [Rariglobus hedericola]TSJ77423.1 response regulator transcription factor [Rariglobus hedericola]
MKSSSTAPTAPAAEAAPVITKRRIFLVDDHPITRQGVAVLINQEPDLEVCGEADSAPKAFDLLQKAKADLAVVDISLKTTSGIELTKNLKVLLPDLPILIMSMHDESLYAERALRAGAKGYVMKQEASESILIAIRRILAGELYLSEKMKEKMLHRLVHNRKDEVVFSIDTLSDREMEVFQLIGNGFSTRQIATKLNLSVKTIDSYREHLKLKLHIEKGADLVRHAIQWVKSENIV